jgi:hypothetical protein
MVPYSFAPSDPLGGEPPGKTRHRDCQARTHAAVAAQQGESHRVGHKGQEKAHQYVQGLPRVAGPLASMAQREGAGERHAECAQRVLQSAACRGWGPEHRGALGSGFSTGRGV